VARFVAEVSGWAATSTGLRGRFAKDAGQPEEEGVPQVLKTIRDGKTIWLVGTGRRRDTGQSDFKNRFTLHDLSRLLPIYDASGYFAIDSHGGAACTRT